MAKKTVEERLDSVESVVDKAKGALWLAAAAITLAGGLVVAAVVGGCSVVSQLSALKATSENMTGQHRIDAARLEKSIDRLVDKVAELQGRIKQYGAVIHIGNVVSISKEKLVIQELPNGKSWTFRLTPQTHFFVAYRPGRIDDVRPGLDVEVVTSEASDEALAVTVGKMADRGIVPPPPPP